MNFTGGVWVYSLLLIGVITLLLGFRIYRLTATFRKPFFAWLLLSISGWSILYAFEIGAGSLDSKKLFASAQYLFIPFIAPTWFLTSLILSENKFRPKLNSTILLMVVPVFTVIMVLTNESHGLIWNSMSLVETSSATLLRLEHGSFFYLYAAYSYLLIAWGAVQMVRTVLGAARIYQISRTAMLVGGLTPLLFNLLYLLGLGPFPDIDLSPFAFTVSALAYSFVFSRRSVVNLHPIARSTILDLIPTGVVVTTLDGLILDSNKSIEEMIGSPVIVGEAINELIPEIPDINRGASASFEIDRCDRTLKVNYSPLPDGDLEGYLVMFEDVTSFEITRSALEETNTQIEEMMEFMPLGIFETNTSGVFMSANRTGLDMTGYNELDIGTKNVLEILTPRDSDRAQEYLDKWSGGEKFIAEYNVIRRDGSVFPVITQSVPIIEDGILTGFRGYTIDLTDQINTQTALAESQELYKTLVDTSPFGIIVASSETITFCNTAAKDILGAPNIDTVRSFHPRHLVLVETPEKETTLADLLLDSAAEGTLDGTNFKRVTHHLEYRKQWITEFENPVCLVLLQDVSARVSDLDRLNEAERRYRALLSSARDIICITDFYGNILDLNDAGRAVIGYGKEELVGSNLIDYIDTEDLNAVVELQRLLQEHGSLPDNYPTTFKLINKTGDKIVADVAITQIQQRNALPHLQFVARDVTLDHDIKEDLLADKKLAELAAQTKSEFLSVMSHEIRTPLNVILGIAQLLRDDNLSQPQSDQVKRILRSGELLMAIINGILDLSKLEAGAVEINHAPFRTRQLFSDVFELYEQLAKQRGLNFSVGVDDAVPELLLGDETRIMQICTNLLGNAIKFTEKGSITMIVRQKSRDASRTPPIAEIEIEVTDTGIGIDTGKIDEIFDQFSQENQTIEKRFGGTGLGLYICRNLVDLMGGTISATSTPGTGSSFVTVLPLDIAQEAPLDQKSPEAPIDLTGLSILVAEDNAMNQVLITEILDRLGCANLVVTDGIEAIEAARTGTFDMVLMDIHMPGLNGLDATKKIRSLEGKLSNIPIIALTAESTAEQKSQCIEAGMTGYISKPINLESLKSVLSKQNQAVEK